MIQKRDIFLAILCAGSTTLSAMQSVSNVSDVFSEGEAYGNIKYYYIQTDKDKSYANQADTSANANSIGGELGFKTASFRGVHAAVTFMTSNPFFISDNPAAVDTSIIGKDNGARGGDATEGFSVMGEAYVTFDYKGATITYGRKIVKTPLLDAKEVRMLPSTFNGFYSAYSINEKNEVGIDYITGFKQRTSDTFVNIIKHALAEETFAVTGSQNGSLFVADYCYKDEGFKADAYEYYAKNFLNSLYLSAQFDKKAAAQWHFFGQYIKQQSVGNAEENLALENSLSGGKRIRVDAFGAKVVAEFGTLNFMLAYSKVLSRERYHDSLVLPWDGTPLFTNMITSNDLFQSVYGNALKADSIYIGGSEGIKVAYKQDLAFVGLKGFSSTLAFLNTANAKFTHGNQRDYNLVLSYKHTKSFSLALKGIWVQNSAGVDERGVVSQIKLLSQYRVIANYKF
jgi:hypothetical protein